jgi:hypothetical protein
VWEKGRLRVKTRWERKKNREKSETGQVSRFRKHVTPAGARWAAARQKADSMRGALEEDKTTSCLPLKGSFAIAESHYSHSVNIKIDFLVSFSDFVTTVTAGKSWGDYPTKSIAMLGLNSLILDSLLPGQSIIFDMARGWESKSVEAQQAEASDKPGKARSKLSPEEAVRLRERENLRLSRQRVIQQLAATQNPRHRQLLQTALAELDRKLGLETHSPKPQA